MPRENSERNRRVLHRARERADLIERRGECQEPVAGDTAVGGLQSHEAAQRRGLSNRPTGVRPERERGHARSHGHG